MVLRSSKYSESTAPYKKCLEFVTPTEVNVTRGDAPPEISWKSTICAEPEKTTKDDTNTIKGLKPSSTPITPIISPKGKTGINNGKTSKTPLVKI